MTTFQSRPDQLDLADSLDERETTIRPEGLLDLARSRGRHGASPVGSMTDRAARATVHGLLSKMTSSKLVIDERLAGQPAERLSFGPDAADDRSDLDHLEATITVTDGRAYRAVALEGSVGLGRGYLESWWDSDDPVAVVRMIIHNLEPVDEFRNRLAQNTGWLTDRVRRVLPRRGRRRNREDIASHYDLGNDFFRIFLDETLTYSSAVFPSAEAALAEASHHKYDRLLAKLGVTADHRVLEIGTGWGGMALRTVDTTGAKVTTTTISSEQLAEARYRVHRAGRHDDVTLLSEDWRDLEGRFDRVVSIEMIEAVDWRDYDRYFATIERCMEPTGLAAIQAICVPDRRYERTKNTEDFIRRFIFPGGFLPSIGAVTRSVSRATRMQVIDVEDFSAHYAETLRRWRERFDERIDEVHALGLDERFCRLWRFYLAYCEAGFLERHCTVNQFVIAGRHWRPDGLELRAT